MQYQLTVGVLTVLIGFSNPAWSVDDVRVSLGGKIFAANCKSCHETGKAENDVPQINETEEWKSRAGGNRAALYKTAIEGFTGYFIMPPKGGNAALSDDDVKAAVDYMLERAGVR